MKLLKVPLQSALGAFSPTGSRHIVSDHGYHHALMRRLRASPTCVLMSTSRDIHVNLAAEHALARAFATSAHAAEMGVDRLMLCYVNDPCVVVGRNQNPWAECDVAKLTAAGVRIARRYSGGGTVYHDPGNINFSFFTSRQAHNPKQNLEWLASFLRRECLLPDADVKVTDRNDLFVAGKKVTGSAMHVGRDTAYHHCTLLVASNLGGVRGSLRPPASRSATIKGNGTASVRSPVTTIMEATGETDDGGLEGGAVARMRAEVARRIALRAADDFLSWDWGNGRPRPVASQNDIAFPFAAAAGTAESLLEVVEGADMPDGASDAVSDAKGVHSVFELEIDESLFPHVVYDDRAAASAVKASTVQDTLVQQRSWAFQCGATPRFSHTQRVHVAVAGAMAECDICIQCERGTITSAQVVWVSSPAPGGVIERAFETIPVALAQSTLTADGVAAAKSACAAGLRLQLDDSEIAEARVKLGLNDVSADDGTCVANHLIDLWASRCAWY